MLVENVGFVERRWPCCRRVDLMGGAREPVLNWQGGCWKSRHLLSTFSMTEPLPLTRA